jgi:TetR/AcrR family transcriptional regulator, transcriptional repressor for nem operon
MDAKENLIVSTQELLWERGYVGMSPKAIQQKAGAGQGSMYHHFSGKAALALAAIERSAADMQAQAESELSLQGSALAQITAYLQREREVLRGCRMGRLAQDPDIIANEALSLPIANTFAHLQQRLAEVLLQGQKNQEFQIDFNAADLATMIVSVLQGSYVLARAENSDASFKRAINGLLHMLSTLIRA